MLKTEGCKRNSCSLFVRHERERETIKCFDGICQKRTHSTATASCSVHNMYGTFAMKSCKICDKMIKISGRVK